jgi:hypothetical protein
MIHRYRPVLGVQAGGDALVLVVQHSEMTRRRHVERVSLHHLLCLALALAALVAFLRFLALALAFSFVP